MKNLSVSVRLTILVAVVCLVTVVVSFSGLRAMSMAIQSFGFVNSDHLVHSRDLQVISSMYSQKIVAMAHKVDSGAMDWSEGRKTLAQARETIRSKWAAHPVDDMVGEEKVQVQGIIDSFARIEPQLDKLAGILEREDERALARFTAGALYPAIEPILGQLEAFIDAQLTEADAEFDRAEENYFFNRNLSLGLTLVGLLLGLWIARKIHRAITGQLSQVLAVARQIESTGDFSRRIEVQSQDEVGQAAGAINRMLQSQQSAVKEVNRVVEGLASGQLDLRIEADMRGDLAQMKEAVNRSAQSVHDTIDRLNQVTAALQSGEFSAAIDTRAQGQYQQALTQAVDAMRALQQMMGDVGQVMQHVSRGDLTRRVSAEGRGDLQALKTDINHSLDALNQVMSVIHGNTRQVASAAGESSNAIGQISDGAQNQTYAITQLAAAVRQTTAAVADVSRNTAEASRKSQESMNIMHEGMSGMQQMVQVVSNIATHSEKINKITEVIESIANKTNLLSLNAAIEAARAGEHGRGFSVVAEEVGKLAASSAESSQEIARLVQEAVVETQRAVTTVQSVHAGMRQIEAGTLDTDSMLRRISTALEQQTSAVEEINSNLTNLDAIARSNAAASEEMTATVTELSRIADSTRQQVERFSTR